KGSSVPAKEMHAVLTGVAVQLVIARGAKMTAVRNVTKLVKIVLPIVVVAVSDRCISSSHRVICHN
ncbi:hypothetical protein, partial [Salmonella sp. s54496]|uniref:hypothetical protein n=1 Tax=Salmonella sp. s54496 TaxID=3159665 RepID=UPI0039808E08